MSRSALAVLTLLKIFVCNSQQIIFFLYSNIQEDGVVAIWDLTEPSFHHEAAQIGNNMLTFQNVTFTTGFFTIFHFYIFLVADVANGNPFFFFFL